MENEHLIQPEVEMFVVGSDGKPSLVRLPFMVAKSLVFVLSHGGKFVGVVTKAGLMFVRDVLLDPKDKRF